MNLLCPSHPCARVSLGLRHYSTQYTYQGTIISLPKTHSSVVKHLGCSQILSTIYSATINIKYIYIYLFELVFLRSWDRFLGLQLLNQVLFNRFLFSQTPMEINKSCFHYLDRIKGNSALFCVSIPTRNLCKIRSVLTI